MVFFIFIIIINFLFYYYNYIDLLFFFSYLSICISFILFFNCFDQWLIYKYISQFENKIEKIDNYDIQSESNNLFYLLINGFLFMGIIWILVNKNYSKIKTLYTFN